MKNITRAVALLALPLCLGLSVMAESYAADASGDPNPAAGAELYDACVPCHALTGKGIAGMSEAKLMKKMKEFQIINTDKPQIQGMKKALAPMSEQDLMDLAAYISKM